MTISNFTRFTGLLLVTGFFLSCSSSKVNIDELIQNNKYQEAITEIDARLAENPAQPELYIQKGKINASFAQDTDPELRPEFYSNTDQNFEMAIEYGALNAQVATIDSLRQQYWKSEHNAGLRITDNDALSDRYHLASIHFKNALILREDAVSSYKNLSVAQFNQGDVDDAIGTLETALEYAGDEPTEIYENLGYLYLEKGDPEQSAYYYELANTNLEEDLNLAFGLVNAYISNGSNEQAVDILESLVANNPDNANLRNVYGTQLYLITSGIMEDLKSAYSNNDTVLVDQILFEAEGMGDEAETQLIEAFRRDTSNTEYLESLAVFYNNLSAQYLSLLPSAFENDKNELENKAYNLINFAIDYYEKLVAIDANNDEYIQKLSVLKTLKN
ncbi:MAG TPA: hypothetical protein DEG32_08720, partial [Balneolaceae bacterium]|nr:hypothetical protein [Balneolaceae bacterium]